MHRNRTWLTSQTETRTQRNRILPIIGGNGSSFGFDFTNTTDALLKKSFLFGRAGTNATYLAANGLITTAGLNEARFEFSESGEPLGLLLEGQGRNWSLYSEDQSNAVWASYTNGGDSPTVTKDGKSTTAPAPDGSFNGNKLIITGVGNNGIYQTLNAALLDVLKTITVSVWVYTESGTSSCRISYFNGTSSAFGSNEVATTKPRRITATFPITATAAGSNVTLSNAGTSTSIVWWGYQVEEGHRPSSYIKTTTADALRLRDNFYATGIDTTWFKQTSGTTIASFTFRYLGAPTANVYPRIFYFYNSTGGAPTASMGYNVSTNRYFSAARTAASGGTSANSADPYTIGYLQNTPNVVGISWGNDIARSIICANGDTPVSYPVTIPYESGISILSFTNNIDGMAIHIKFFQHWKESKAPAELRSLVNNGRFGFSPSPSEPLTSGDLGYIGIYNGFAEDVFFASPLGGTQNNFGDAGQIYFNSSVDVGFRPVLIVGTKEDLSIAYNPDDTEPFIIPTANFNTALPILSGQYVTFGLGPSITTPVSGRIEIYEYTTKQTILAFQFNT